MAARQERKVLKEQRAQVGIIDYSINEKRSMVAMDAVKFIEERNRMCKSFGGRCKECPGFDVFEEAPCIFDRESTVDATAQIAIVEEWSAAHPRKTRQSELLKQCPEAAIDDYGVLSYAEKNKSVYDNLVKSMISGDPKLTIQPGAQKVFGLKEDGSASSSTAIVVNGDYTWDAAQQSAYPDLHFILASGNVHVNADFEGLIIAGQNVIFGNGNVSLTANSSLAAESLGALNEDGKKAADYLVNGDTYLTGTAGKKDVQSGVISFDDYISYSNWKKQ